MTLDLQAKAKQLSHVYWIGGSPCSGKSSVVNLLADRFGLQAYHTDDNMEKRAKMANPEHQPTMTRLSALTWDELWKRPVADQVSEELEYYREEYPMVLDELLTLPTDRPILAEGTGLLPECLAELITSRSQAIWMVPSYQFQWTHYSKREFISPILNQCRNPEQAFKNWMDRDAGFGKAVAAQAERLGFQVIEIDGQQSLDQIADIAARHFGLHATGIEKEPSAL